MARLREPGTRASWKAVRTAIIHSAPARLQAARYQVKSIAVRDACQAVKNAKLHYKETGEFSQVEFRRRKDPRQGCFIPASAVSQTGIYPTILGPLRMAENIPNDHRDSRLTLSHGQFHLAVPVETQRREAETQGRVVALDPGIRSFLTWFSETDAGHIGQQDFGRIQRLCTHLDNLLGRAARARHQQKRNMYRAAGRMRTRIRNLVDELHHKTARFLVDHYDIILLPTFETSEMALRGARKLRRKSVRNLLTFAHYRFQRSSCGKRGRPARPSCWSTRPTPAGPAVGPDR